MPVFDRESSEAFGGVIDWQQLSAMLYDYSHLASKLSAADFSHKYISKKAQSWLILKCIIDTSSFSVIFL